MSKDIYRVQLPDKPEGIVFINGMRGKTLMTKLWVHRIALNIRKAVHKADGLVCVYGGIVAFGETIMVSYWKDKAALYGFMNTKLHKKARDFVMQNPDKFSSYNETYLAAPCSAAYIGDPRGLALIYTP